MFTLIRYGRNREKALNLLPGQSVHPLRVCLVWGLYVGWVEPVPIFLVWGLYVGWVEPVPIFLGWVGSI